MKYAPKLIFFVCFTFIVQFFAMDAKSQKIVLRWQKMANGVWKAEIGKPEGTNLLSISGVAPNTKALNDMPIATFPISDNEIKVEIYVYRIVPVDKQ